MRMIQPFTSNRLIVNRKSTNLTCQKLPSTKQLLKKLNKTGSTLAKLRPEVEGMLLCDQVSAETSQFSDKLNGMLTALTNAFEKVKSAEPISAHSDKIQEEMQIKESIVEDFNKSRTDETNSRDGFRLGLRHDIWLTNAEKTLSGFKPVSRAMETFVALIITIPSNWTFDSEDGDRQPQ
ncbi:hypothetical protein DAPPUDRAFT_313824 [Daphnia pulex]|uniref:Uncharacterized protein n=1 Tax=Daphnia pulex TaxID=6669 RepID=E9G5D8_DAPPU|nr:hypothetical protein DAPPUDRAFT_313824 [Daphnia pulex]|eukprot:EFX85190.1 hypothetical protein DAPPUDRAFT_313824 [Daphnia pulex]